MAVKSKAESSNKITFGVKRVGKAKKRFNKKDKSERNYRGQGRG